MIAGTPLLAVYDATGVFRTFELAGGVFTQMASQGGFVQGSNPVGDTYPYFQWAGDRIVVVRSISGTQRTIELLDMLLASVASVFQNAGASSAVYRAGYGRETRIVSILPVSGSNGTVLKHKVEAGGLVAESHGNPNALGATDKIVVSPDGAKWPQLGGTVLRNVLNPGPNQNWTNGGSVVARASLGAWDASSRYLTVGVPGDAYATVMRWGAGVTGGYEAMQQIEHPAGTFYAVAGDPYGKYLAIGWALTAGGYETRIYERQGNLYQYKHTLAGMGRLLDFSANGSILVDGAARKVAVFNGTSGQYEDNAGMAANLPTGTVAQAISDHAPVVLATSSMYQAGLEMIAAGTLDTAALKLTVANDTAPAFDIDHGTLAEAIGTAELTTGGWPAGGIPVLNVTTDGSVSGAVRLLADDPERIIILSSATFRYAFLHLNDVPIIRYDFQQNVTVAQNAKAVFEVPDAGLLNFLM